MKGAAPGRNLRSSPPRPQRQRAAPPRPEDLTGSRLERRASIVRAALRLLNEAGYDEIQIHDVADAAGVSLGTVYRYFASKEHLFAAVLVEWSASLERRIEERPPAGDGAAAQIGEVCRRVIDAFERLPQFFRLMTSIETTLDPYARERYEHFVATTRGAFGGPLESLHPDDADAVLDVMMMVLGGVTRSWALGLISTDEAKARLARAIDVVFSPPPRTRTA